ncbi:MAG: pyridoxamine 5'-phosphate oxidase family protein, partial [Acidimicrobiales bacterium]
MKLIESAPVVHVGIETSRGAHVTPQAFAFVDGNIWLVASRKSLKVRVLQNNPEVGLMMRGPEASVTLAGTAKVLWAESAADAISMVGATAWMPAMAGSYATRNWRLMLGLGADVVERPASFPYDRVVIRVSPTRGAHCSGDALASTFGDWTSASGGRALIQQSQVELPESVPVRPASLAYHPGPCSLAVVTDAGP